MNNHQIKKQFDLEERTFEFAKNTRFFLKTFKRTYLNSSDIDQLIRSSGSVAANYVEANEALSRKDFLNRIKICRKEAKESLLWLNLLVIDDKYEQSHQSLLKECTEIMKIFGAIVSKIQ